jgi:hypothetical protein
MMHILNKIFDEIYVITHKKSERIENVKKVLDGVDFEFFYGIEKEDLNMEQLPKEGYPNLQRYQFSVTFTHLDLMKKLKSEHKTNILIFEDDILLRMENIHYLESEYNKIKNNFDLFYLGFTNQHINYDNLIKPNLSQYLWKGFKRSFKNDSYLLEGSNAYVIGSENFLDLCINYQENKPKFEVIDGLFWRLYEYIDYYCIIPQICIQDLKLIDYKR